MRLFVTGISGFVGTHLVRRLLEAGHEVFGVSLEGWTPALDPLLGEGLPRERVSAVDVRDGEAVRRAVAAARPDGVFHLAGIAFLPRAEADPRLAWEVNLLGTVSLLEGVRRECPGTRTVVVTSGEVYGRTESGPEGLDESLPLRPVSPYGASKAAADLAALQAHLGAGLDVVRARPFNHTGPGQAPVFVCSEFARAVADAETGRRPPRLRVGNLDAERDFSDVRDVVDAYVALFERGHAGQAYNVASGRATAVRTILERLRARSGVAIEVEVDRDKLRPGEVPRIVGSIARLQRDTGWRPRIPLERTLDDLLDWARREAAGRPAD